MSEKLLLEIAKCPITKQCLNGLDSSLECWDVVKVQGTADPNLFQLPEPWSGHLDKAPLLIVSFNPSISKKEEYPTFLWNDDQIVDFFENRFDPERGWVENGIYPRRTDGEVH
jgi:hypothetical protein